MKTALVLVLVILIETLVLRSCGERAEARDAYIEKYKASMNCEHVGYKGRGETKLYRCGVTGVLKTDSEM